LSNSTHWKTVSQIYHSIGQPPLQPNQEVINYFYHRVPKTARMLMLGVTPLIASSYDIVTAVDKESKMIENLWIGNTSTKKVINDNWLTVELPLNHYDGILGDCSANVLPTSQDVVALFEHALNWLTPGGYFACRFFTRPLIPVTLEQLQAQATHPTMNFSAYKRLLPAYIAAQTGNGWVTTKSMAELFNELFPNRSNLPWDEKQLASIDRYAVNDGTTWFPTRQEVFDLIPVTARHVQFVDVGTYDLAENCPILEFTK
jgi:hypothetical protein